MYIILIYDIEQENKGAAITRNVFKIAKKYLIHIQKSVFEGELSEVQLFKMELELKKYLRDKENSCIIFSSNNKKWLSKKFLTEATDDTSNFI